MRNVDEYISNSVDKSSQPHAYEIAEELWDLLKALDQKGFVRTRLRGATREEKRETYALIQKNADRILEAFNKFYDMYMNEKKRERFFELTKEFGFTDEDLMHLLHVQLMFTFLLNTEMFKNFFTFILKNVKPTATLGNLFGKEGTLAKQTLENGEARKISKRLDIELRNSLAHFTFREVGASIHCYEHMKRNSEWVLNEIEINSSDLFRKMQEQSLIRAIIASVIADWYAL